MNYSLHGTNIDPYPYHEYLLVLNPNAGVNEKILQVKEEFSKKYKILSARHSHAHIILVNFLQYEMRETRLINCLNTIAMGYRPFTISLKGYESFPNHTLFINIESKQQVRNLIKELAPGRRLMTLNKEKKPHFMDDPHVTVARNLLPWQYEQSWNEYRRKHFTAHFIAESMVLLRRSLAVGSNSKSIPGKYQKVMQFQFLNLPVTTNQGELFS